MKTIGDLVVSETIIERSRFICYLRRISSIEEGTAFVNEIKKKHWDANHNCSAMVYHNNARSSDDGEPSGTAGVPMLNAIKHNDLDEVVAVVTRYFGGTKLGAGGLIRAYGGAVSEAIKQARIAEIIEMTVVDIMVDYSNANTLQSKIEVPIQNQEYLSEVRFTFYIEPSRVNEFIEQVRNITSANFTHHIKENIMHEKN